VKILTLWLALHTFRVGVEGVAPEVTEAAMQGQTVVYVGKLT
jgi:hypothetical protein